MIKPFSLIIKGTDDIVHVNTTLTNSKKAVTINDVGTLECRFRLTMLFATNLTQFEQFFLLIMKALFNY